MREEIVLASEHTRDDLHLRPRHEVEEAARHWFATAKAMKTTQDALVEDLEQALNFCRNYQDILARMQLNDPNLVGVRSLLTKYKMDHTHPTTIFRVFVDGVDITDHPDSIPGTVVEHLELTYEEYYDTDTAELVQDAQGHLHLVQQGPAEIVPDADILAEEPEPKGQPDAETREWLNPVALGEEPVDTGNDV